MYNKVKKTEFGVGYMGDEYMIALPAEFQHNNSIMESTLLVDTFYDDLTGNRLFLYKDKLLTVKELRREYLKDYYEVK